MIEKIKNLFKHNFVKDTAILQVGTFFSTGLSFLASMIFARVLGPENYGQYALIFALTGLIQIFMNWGADYATITLLAEAWARRDKEEVKNLIVFFIKTSLIVAFTVGLLGIIFASIIAGRLYNNSHIGNLARFVLTAGVIQFVFSTLTIILQASRKIKELTIIENTNKIFYIAIPSGLVLFGFGLNGIVWGQLISAFIFFIFSFYFYKFLCSKTDMLPKWKEILVGIKNVSIKKYFKFGFLIAIDKNLSNLYSVLPMTFLGMSVGTEEISYFKIAFSYIGLSLMFLGPISRLLMVQLPKSKVAGIATLKEHFFKTAFYSFLIILGIVAPMVFLGKYLILIFYGEKYLPSVKLIYMLWPYALIMASGIGLGAFYRAVNKMKVSIFINLINLIIGAPIFYFMIRNYGTTGMAIATICWIGITVLISLIYIKNYFKKNI
jgi:O-antigen/teichoic acid export membrane protein